MYFPKKFYSRMKETFTYFTVGHCVFCSLPAYLTFGNDIDGVHNLCPWCASESDFCSIVNFGKNLEEMKQKYGWYS